MIRMLLIGYLNGLRSERRLCAEVHLNLAHRCAEAGLVPGEGAAVYGSQVEADASRHKRLHGTGPFLTRLSARGVVAPHIPVLDRTHQTDGMFTRASFTYEEAEDAWRCPSGYMLGFAGLERGKEVERY